MTRKAIAKQYHHLHVSGFVGIADPFNVVYYSAFEYEYGDPDDDNREKEEIWFVLHLLRTREGTERAGFLNQ
jgi:hypothetical protein